MVVKKLKLLYNVKIKQIVQIMEQVYVQIIKAGLQQIVYHIVVLMVVQQHQCEILRHNF